MVYLFYITIQKLHMTHLGSMTSSDSCDERDWSVRPSLNDEFSAADTASSMTSISTRLISSFHTINKINFLKLPLCMVHNFS